MAGSTRSSEGGNEDKPSSRPDAIPGRVLRLTENRERARKREPASAEDRKVVISRDAAQRVLASSMFQRRFPRASMENEPRFITRFVRLVERRSLMIFLSYTRSPRPNAGWIRI